jgi:hypothetical protein
MGTPSAGFNEKRVVKNGIGCDDGAASGSMGKISDILAFDFGRNVGYWFKRTKGPI